MKLDTFDIKLRLNAMLTTMGLRDGIKMLDKERSRLNGSYHGLYAAVDQIDAEIDKIQLENSQLREKLEANRARLSSLRLAGDHADDLAAQLYDAMYRFDTTGSCDDEMEQMELFWQNEETITNY
jgi:predicted nuclease with TOPRIM domain